MDNLNTEDKILQAAENEFIEHGFSGARMQNIANKAGINKALLHYYFRSKEKLFGVIFQIALKIFVPKILRVFERDDLDFFEKIRTFVAEYMNVILKNPHIPGFIIHEISTKGSTLSKIISEIDIDISPIQKQVDAEIAKGTIRPIQTEQLIMNVVSLSIFPIVAMPIAKIVLFQGDDKKYKQFIEARKIHVSDFIINSIKIN